MKENPTLFAYTSTRGTLSDHRELIIDLFAGGGGASSGLELGLGRSPDIAINHDAAAVALHAKNHPLTQHFVSDVFEVDPRKVTEGRPVGFLWASPDCTYHSKARGAKPIRSGKKKRRALAWVVTRWAGQVKPRVIMLENVEEFAEWGPLIGKVDQLKPCPKRRGKTFRRWVRSLRDLGYNVEWRELRACDYGAPTIRKRLYLIARCDGEAIVWPEPTHGPKCAKPYRTAAECIDWSIPMLSIFATKEEAAEWGRFHKQAAPIRPLAENTNRRIARGVMRYVVNNPKPFIVRTDMTSAVARNGVHCVDEPVRTITTANAFAITAPIIAPVTHANLDRRTPAANEPLATITCAQRGEQALVAPYLVPRYGEAEGQEPRSRSLEEPAPAVVNTNNGGSLVAVNIATYHTEKGDGEARGAPVDLPLPTLDTSNRYGVVASFLAQNNGGFCEMDGRQLQEPLATVLANGSGHHGLIGASLLSFNHDAAGKDIKQPMPTVTANNHGAGSNPGGAAPIGIMAAHMVQSNHGAKQEYGADEPVRTIVAGGTHEGIAAVHLQQDYGQSVGYSADEPARTVTGGGGGHANIIASFLAKYYGQGTGQEVTEPVHTIPTVDRFGLVTVTVDGEEYYIADIAMRMLRPRELYTAQGFRTDYIIDVGIDGQRITATEQVRMCGNSVSPPVAAALASANCPELILQTEVAA